MMEETDNLQNVERVPENAENPVLPNPENRERDLQEANPTIQPEENTPEAPEAVNAPEPEPATTPEPAPESAPESEP